MQLVKRTFEIERIYVHNFVVVKIVVIGTVVFKSLTDTGSGDADTDVRK